MPDDKKVTAASVVCNHRPLKDEQWRVRLVVRGYKLEYEFDSVSPETDLVEKKLVLISVILDANIGAKFVTIDLKDMFLHTPIEHPE